MISSSAMLCSVIEMSLSGVPLFGRNSRARWGWAAAETRGCDLAGMGWGRVACYLGTLY